MAKPLGQGAELTPFRRRAFVVITLSLPVAFLVLLEIGLRIAGYGADVSLFRRVEVRHRVYYQMNPAVKVRYFGTSRFAPSASPHYFRSPKPAGVYRIFCLGGSTTAGYPYSYNGAFPAFLAERLKAIFPAKKVEVINLGMTATNSITVLDFARDLMKFQPDLIIDYGGHNEFYGALGAASNRTVGSSRFITALYLKLVHFRTFQLVQDAVHTFSGIFPGKSNASHGTMMERLARGQYVPRGSGLYNVTYDEFRENLLALKDLCRSEGVPLILGTQVSNLRDEYPFVSGISPALSPEKKSAFLKLFHDGEALQKEGKFDSAAVVLRLAIETDSSYAAAHYRLARCLDTTGVKEEALREYILARDYDELRFRTDSKFNNLILSMADGKGVYVADVEKLFKGHSPDSLIGHNLITEHLHPNSRGNFLIAECYSRAMQAHGLLASRSEWASADTISDLALWEKRHVTGLDERITKEGIKFLTSGWPFKDQLPAVVPVSRDDTLGVIAQDAAVGRLDWVEAHREAVRYYERRRDYRDAEKEYEAIMSVYPMDLQLYFDLAKLYLRDRRLDEVREVMQESLQVYPTLEAYRTLGDLMMQKRDAAGALRYYEKMDGFKQTPSERVGNEMALSYAYAVAGRLQEARSKLLNILATNPDSRGARQLLQYVDAEIERGTGQVH